MITVLALSLALHAPPPGSPWFGSDKVKHFFMSALVQSASFSISRAAGLDHSRSHLVAGITTASVGVWKELHDKRSRKPFSVSDLVWDAAGGAASAALLNRSR